MRIELPSELIMPAKKQAKVPTGFQNMLLQTRKGRLDIHVGRTADLAEFPHTHIQKQKIGCSVLQGRLGMWVRSNILSEFL